MAALINSPPTNAVDVMDASGAVPALTGIDGGWRNFFMAVYTICVALTSSGTTANRPTKLLWTGRFYFDTTLGLPIFYKTSSWVKADGSAA